MPDTTRALAAVTSSILDTPTHASIPGEVRKDGVGGLWPHDGAERLAARAPDARDAAECLEQRAPPPRADAGNLVERRTAGRAGGAPGAGT